MPVYSMFLDKDEYYNRGRIGKYKINNLAEIINMYLDLTPEIDTVYIAGACYGRKKEKIKNLIEICFNTKSKKSINIALIRKYRGFSYVPTIKAIKKTIHKYINVGLDTGKSDHRKMIFFLSKGKIMAVMIGSSNYSPNTYLNDLSSEADIFFFDYNVHNNSKKVNSGIVKMLEEEFSKKTNKELTLKTIISKSLNDNDFLQDMFIKVVKNAKKIKEY